MFRSFVSSYLDGLEACRRELSLEKLESVLNILLLARQEGRKIFILGNGGSASAASHFACDLGKGTAAPGVPRFRVISLTDNVALLTAWANDTSYEMVFREQLENLLEPGDVVIGISASGNSPNVLRAIEYANEHGAITIGLVGCGGGKLKKLVQVDLTISSTNIGQAEEVHLTLNHVLTQYLAQALRSEAQRQACSESDE